MQPSLNTLREFGHAKIFANLGSEFEIRYYKDKHMHCAGYS
jgi:hypothetical protein